MNKVYVLVNDTDSIFFIFSTRENAEKFLRKVFLPDAVYDDFIESYYDPKLNPNGIYEGNGDEYFISVHPLDPEGGI